MALLYTRRQSHLCGREQHDNCYLDTQSEAARSLRAVEKVSFSLRTRKNWRVPTTRKAMRSRWHLHEQLPGEYRTGVPGVLLGIESKRFDSLYKQIDLAPEESKSWSMKRWKTMPRLIKRHPSYFTGSPRHDSGNKTGSERLFVSANAEQFYQYQPSEIIL